MSNLPLHDRARALPLILAVGVLFALVCVKPASCGPSQLIRNLQAGQMQTVVTYGTSLTYSAWPNQLSAWLESEFPGQVDLLNSGVPSMASQHANPNLHALNRLDLLVLSHSPDTVFLEFAINDALTGNNISPQQSQDNLNTMIDRILADDPACEIILMTMNPAWDSPRGSHATFRPNLAQYYQGYRDVAAQRDLLLIDHDQNWIELRDNDPTLFMQSIPDGVHPTEEALRQIVTPEIIRALTIPEPAALIMAIGPFLAAATSRRFHQRVPLGQ